ncbi:MAG: hypothetical protein ABH919_00850 [bacterium]
MYFKNEVIKMGLETVLLEDTYKQAIEEIIYGEFPKIIETAERKLAITEKWDDSFIKVKLPAEYLKAIRYAHEIKTPMEKVNMERFVAAIFEDVADYKTAPPAEFDEKYREAVIAKVGRESERSVTYKTNTEVFEEINSAYRAAHDKMSEMKMRRLKTTVPLIPVEMYA